MYAAGQAKNLQVFFYCSDALFGAVVFIVDKYNKEQKGLRARDGGFQVEYVSNLNVNRQTWLHPNLEYTRNDVLLATFSVSEPQNNINKTKFVCLVKSWS